MAHKLHTDNGLQVRITDPYTGTSRRRKARRVLLDVVFSAPDGTPLYKATFDQENFLLRVAEATGSIITRPKAPAVYDGTKR